VVTGPAGQEIHTDKYGRVKIQFAWDRYGKKNECSSCWVRVASPWAGASFGFVQVPRIGQEVIVDFLEGDPDQPIITGRVYNGNNMPPWELPANATQSGVLTRSSQGGAYGHANALRFEDKKGEEQLWIHAEKNQDIEVENDETHWVGRDRAKTIDRDETTHVKRDRTETVDRHETITVHGKRTETVDQDETITIHQNRKERVDHNENVSIGGNRVETVTLAKAETIGLAKALSVGLGYQVSVGAAMNTTVGLSQTEQVLQSKSTAVGTTYEIQAQDRFTLVVGKSSITLTRDGEITLAGVKVQVIGSDSVTTTSPNIHNN
jgi:type VI secretion system secreted protein VgrG